MSTMKQGPAALPIVDNSNRNGMSSGVSDAGTGALLCSVELAKMGQQVIWSHCPIGSQSADQIWEGSAGMRRSTRTAQKRTWPDLLD
jgi:hypothetical protein